MKKLAIAALLAASLIAPAQADLDKGTAAYKRGDYVAAHREFMEAAHAGQPRAKYSLGLMYLRGQGVAQDLPQAIKWLREAADKGDGEARMVLGDLYRRDAPGLRDYVKSYLWLTLSLARVRGIDRVRALKLRGEVKAQMKPEQIARADRLIKQWRALENTAGH